MQAKHGIQDRGKYQALKQIFAAAQRWPDSIPPMLRNDNYELLTGSHRYAAARAAGLDDSQMETIEIPEILYECEDLYDWDDYELACHLAGIGEPALARIACTEWEGEVRHILRDEDDNL